MKLTVKLNAYPLIVVDREPLYLNISKKLARGTKTYSELPQGHDIAYQH